MLLGFGRCEQHGVRQFHSSYTGGVNWMDVDIEGDISRALTLPARFYSDASVFEAQRRHVFARSWQLIGDLDQVRIPGQVQPLTMLEGCVDEPLLLTRDLDDQLHCLSNVCTHRGALVCEGPGTQRHLRCRYHGRRFKLDGSFEFMPEFDTAKGFPSAADDLPRLPLEQWGKLLFASLEPAAPFREVFGPVIERMSWLPIDQFRFDPARSRDYLVQANWALYCDNYLEGFHIPFVHASLNEVIDYGSYRTELFDWCSLQIGHAKGADAAFDLPRQSPDHGSPVAGHYFFVFPNTMFNFYPWGLSINIVKPLAVDRTRISYLAYVWDERKLAHGAGAELDRVEREDEAVVESVQRGVRSRLYERGRYSPTREQGVHHFHRMLVQSMKGHG